MLERGLGEVAILIVIPILAILIVALFEELTVIRIENSDGLGLSRISLQPICIERDSKPFQTDLNSL